MLQVTFVVSDLSNTHSSRNMACINYDMLTCKSENVCCLSFQLSHQDWQESQRHIHCTSGNVSEMVQDRNVVTMNH